MEKIDTMILIIIISYLVASILIIYMCTKKRKRYSDFPSIKVVKNGLIFQSKSRHRIKINDAKYVLINDMIYLKTPNKMVIIKNICNVYKIKDYLYFLSLGECRIIFDCKDIYKYYNIKIKSEYIDIENLKRQSILELMNNLFDIRACKTLAKYLKVLKNMLNITIEDKKIKVKANKYRIPFTLIYRIDDRIKKIKIEQSF